VAYPAGTIAERNRRDHNKQGEMRKIVAVPLAAAAVLVGEVLHMAHRRDLPSLENQDPSGVFGDPDLPELSVVALGDSSVTAPGVEPLDASWIRRIAHDLSRDHHVHLHSVAVGGAKSADVLRDQLEVAIALAPDIAVVSVGANDALRATPVARFERELNQIVSRLADTARIGVAVTGIGDLGTIPRLPSVPRAYARVRSRSFDRATQRVAAAYPNTAKATTWGPTWGQFEYEPDMFAGDLFHASAEGHAIFGSHMIPVIRSLLSEDGISGS
jgi:lysophospholipase L1-like esterase